MSAFPGYRQLPRPRSTSTPPRSPQRAAPGSPRRRRQFFEVSEEASGDHSIEDFIYLSDPYRSTSIRPRYPLPMLYLKAPADLLNRLEMDRSLATLSSEIKEVLKEHHIDRTSLIFCSMSKPGYTDDVYDGNIIDGNVVLRIDAQMEDEEDENQWSQARRAVHSLLQDKDIDVHVEIFDPNRSYQPSLFPISPDDIYIKIYESFRDSMAVDIEAALRDSWASMCLYKIGNLFTTSEYAVVIMVLPFTVHDWQALKVQLRNKYMRGAATSASDITIHFVPGRMVVNHEPSGKDLTTTLPTSFPNMGSSIGVDGEWGGGTLGAFMSLNINETRDHKGIITEPAREIRGFVTNSHVTAPRDITPPAIIESYHKDGVDWNADPLGPRRTLLKYPAEADLVATTESISWQVNHFAQMVTKQEQKIDEAEAYGDESGIAKFQMYRKNWAENLAEYKERKALCDRLPLALGRTYWASGRAMHDGNGSIDFAFVKIPSRNAELWEHCANDNPLPRKTDHGLKGHLPQDYAKTNEGLEGVVYAARAQMMHDFGDIIKGHWYFKTGRSTDVTSGLCHGTEAFCKMTTPEERKKRIYSAAGGRSEYADHGYTTELIIVRTALSHQSETDIGATMSRSGDSGSIYLDDLGRPAGLGFGSLSGACGPMACEQAGWTDPTSGNIQSQRERPVGNIYGASISLVTPMPRIQEHLRLRINGELGFCSDTS